MILSNQLSPETGLILRRVCRHSCVVWDLFQRLIFYARWIKCGIKKELDIIVVE